MTTTVFLVRHAAHDRLNRILCGRMPGVSLGADGRAQAAALAERLAREKPRGGLCEPARARPRDGASRSPRHLEIDVQVVRRAERNRHRRLDRPRPSTICATIRTGRAGTRRAASRGRPAARRCWRRRRAWSAGIERLCAAHPDAGHRARQPRRRDQGRARSTISACRSTRSCASRSRPASISKLVVGDWGAKVITHERGACRMKIVVFGLTISSSWGNGHATLWRGLCRALAAPRPPGRLLRARRALLRRRTATASRCPAANSCSTPSGTTSGAAPRARSPTPTSRWSRPIVRTASRRPMLVIGRAARVSVFYDLDTPVTLSRLSARRDRRPISARAACATSIWC